MIDLTCPRCGRLHHAGNEHIGKSLRCAGCGDTIPIIYPDHERANLTFPSGTTQHEPIKMSPTNSRNWKTNARGLTPHFNRYGWMSLILAILIIAVLATYQYLKHKPELVDVDRKPKESLAKENIVEQPPLTLSESSVGGQQVIPNQIAIQPQNAIKVGSSQRKLQGPISVKPRKHEDIGVDLVVPIFSEIRLMDGPSSGMTQMGKATDKDILVLLSRESNDGWYNVIDVKSGKEAWVNANDVSISLTTHSKDGPRFTEENVGSNSLPDIEVVNNTERELSLKIDQDFYIIKPRSTLPIQGPNGTFSYYATAPHAIPLMGRQEFRRGHKYNWKFWIEKSLAP